MSARRVPDEAASRRSTRGTGPHGLVDRGRTLDASGEWCCTAPGHPKCDAFSGARPLVPVTRADRLSGAR
jgi:hypothetical protein